MSRDKVESSKINRKYFMFFMFLLSKIDFPDRCHTLIIKDLWLPPMKAAPGRK